MAIHRLLTASARARRLTLSSLAVLAAAVYLLALGAAPSGALVSGSFGVQPRKETTFEKTALRYHGGPVLTSSVTYSIYWDPTLAYRSEWLQRIDGYLHDVGADSGKLSNLFSVDTQYTGPAGTRANYQSTFRGAYTDTNKYPGSGCKETGEGATCLTAAQISSELSTFIEANHLPTGLGVIYFVMTPPGVHVCTDVGEKGNCSNSTAPSGKEPNGFCSYHSAIEPGSVSPTVYAVVPWVAGSAGRVKKQLPLETEGATADVLFCQNRAVLVEANQTNERGPYGDYRGGNAEVIINQLSIQQLNVVNNPLLNAWYRGASNQEEGDVCQGGFSPAPEELPKVPDTTKALPLSDETINGHAYYLQYAFNSTDVSSGKGITCWQGVGLQPHFTHPNPVNIGDVVGFDGYESSFTLNANVANLQFPGEEPFTAPIYTFDFGDGTVVTSGNASVYHAYGAAGTYNPVLTVADSGANVATFASPVTVVGPVVAPISAGGSGAPAQAQGGQPGGKSPSSPSGAPKPNAAAAAASRSLRRALRSGLVVRYSVNERVSGRFEVMIASSLARRLHLRGQSATGLAAGTPPQTVIGKAIVFVNSAGNNTLRIQFGKNTANRLERLHSVTLLLRMFVRNSAAQSTTVLNTVTLSR